MGWQTTIIICVVSDTSRMASSCACQAITWCGGVRDGVRGFVVAGTAGPTSDGDGDVGFVDDMEKQFQPNSRRTLTVSTLVMEDSDVCAHVVRTPRRAIRSAARDPVRPSGSHAGSLIRWRAASAWNVKNAVPDSLLSLECSQIFSDFLPK